MVTRWGALVGVPIVLSFVLCDRVGIAGDYHEGLTLSCSECHVMHRSPAEQGGTGGEQGTSETVGKLLQRNVNDLCLSCHDDSSRATDVLGANRGPSAGAVRQAGFLNRVGGIGQPPTGHTLGSLEMAPGSQPSWSASDDANAGKGLNCSHCHDPHGSMNSGHITYRNLRADAGNNRGSTGLVTYNHERAGVRDPSRDVFVRRALDYDEAAVDFNEPNAQDSAIGRFCAGCHDLFHGVPGQDATIGGRPHAGGIGQFVRHPVAGVDLGSGGDLRSDLRVFASHRNRVKVMSSSGDWSTPGPDVTPTCISCHKAHGNDNPFGLIYRSGRGRLTENGDSEGRALEDLCRQCHAEDSTFATRG